ncbi:hypothetical protein LFL96_30055 [Paraburkholderia sp. D15]|uniref:hypothetical protein n=1 Tax=Paraburkholderia sp. D15 TaxID=2880218 RepID=UPI002479089C|nr:hypothetical protein [Paraburkholderia sp. D15]WGS52439.1 hypothetical protein LFL96_30055 [Paraburkholderia sp. D15]
MVDEMSVAIVARFGARPRFHCMGDVVDGFTFERLLFCRRMPVCGGVAGVSKISLLCLKPMTGQRNSIDVVFLLSVW